MLLNYTEDMSHHMCYILALLHREICYWIVLGYLNWASDLTIYSDDWYTHDNQGGLCELMRCSKAPERVHTHAVLNGARRPSIRCQYVALPCLLAPNGPILCTVLPQGWVLVPGPWALPYDWRLWEWVTSTVLLSTPCEEDTFIWWTTDHHVT